MELIVKKVKIFLVFAHRKQKQVLHFSNMMGEAIIVPRIQDIDYSEKVEYIGDEINEEEIRNVLVDIATTQFT